MKKYLTVFLILNFLLQFVGCYSLSEISLEELKDYGGEKDIVLKTNKEEVLINRKPNEFNSMNWEAGDSLITIKIKNRVSNEDYNRLTLIEYFKVVNEEIKIKYTEIQRIETEKINWIKTSILLAGIGIIVLLGFISSNTGSIPPLL